MKKLTIFFAVTAMVAVANPAFANGNGPPPFGNGGDSTAVGVGVGVADAEASANANSAASAVSIQDQKAVTGDQSVTVKGDDYDLPASSSASLVLGTCQAGMSAQTIQGGGSLGSPDEVCLLFTAAQVAQSQGRFVLAGKLLDEAVDILRVRTNPVRRFFQGVPLLGRVF